MEKLTFKDKDYFFSKLTFEHLDEFTDWASGQIKNPIDEVRSKLEGFSPEHQKMMLEAAVAQTTAVISAKDERVNNMMFTKDGRVMLLSLMLKDRHSDLTAKERLNLTTEMNQQFGSDKLFELVAKLLPKKMQQKQGNGNEQAGAKKNSRTLKLNESSIQLPSLTGIPLAN